ncbi:uncharacterized protein LOC130967785 [Arachis stenosperma]|uniref:uncharacterized protein LOC130967785 n=1 Tax=Arachis stenosperma TaxID=217475 RepID=UPI0025AD6421|nr:uncharacterized protein LOC130967785 [Arachis stenosperma]
MEKVEQPPQNWSEAAEDLAAAGDTDGAIAFIESVISNLELQTLKDPSDSIVTQLQLASALTELATLYSSKGFSLKADELRTRASLIKQTQQNDARVGKEYEGERIAPTNLASSSSSSSSSCKDSNFNGDLDRGLNEKHAELPAETSPYNDSSDDDWEAMADRKPDELLPTVSSDCIAGVSNLKLENSKSPAPKRRGRGTFSYEKHELYSDQLRDSSVDDVEDEGSHCNSEDKKVVQNAKYGTAHVLVLADFPPSTRTIELERLFEDFKDRGFVIRWVNDTVALAVFQTPSVALEARKSIRCPFNVRILSEDDTLLGSIKTKDLEPPRQRPKTSAQAAQRLIAHGMGLKLPSVGSGSREHRKQEDARRDRIVTRQKLRDEAWGDD